MFDRCEICSADDWHVAYQGPIRDGSFGKLTSETVTIARCGNCSVDRLAESACRDTGFYESEQYRKSLNEPTDTAGFMARHDVLQLQSLKALWPESLRHKVVADIGCGAGSFLDHVCGLSREAIAVDPCKLYHDSLKARRYAVYSIAEDAAADWAERVDFAFSFSVVEHVLNPRSLLEDIGRLLTDEGKLMVSTPNRRDALMDLGGQEYQQFFYRVAHRWYFDVDSFSRCAQEAGLEVTDTRYVHRFGLSNAMAWLRDRKPTGDEVLPHLDNTLLDGVWRTHLESRGVSDYLYFIVQRRSGA